jgi:hypothetical protein
MVDTAKPQNEACSKTSGVIHANITGSIGVLSGSMEYSTVSSFK